MRYEIIATLGPSSADPAIWQAMLAAGATAFRLNTSHVTLDQVSQWLEEIRQFRIENGQPVPLVLDLQGSKWRLGEFPTLNLRPGEVVRLVLGEKVSRPGCLPVPHADFFQAARFSNGEIILNDARNQLVVLEALATSLTTRVVTGGEISAHKGITFGETQFRVETIGEKDSQILKMAAGDAAVRIAVSYVRDAVEMEKYRRVLGKTGYLIAKLERAPAMADAAKIARTCDELWVCRGDLGAELGLRGMAEAVAALASRLSELPVPVMMAGQVLEHMTEHPTPTRSEVCYLRDGLAQGYRGFVLSDEAAIGRYPVESCRTAALFQDD